MSKNKSGRYRQPHPNWLQGFFRRYTFLALLGLSIIAGMLFGLTVAYQASMTEDGQVSNPAEFSRRLNSLLVRLISGAAGGAGAAGAAGAA